MDCIELRKLYKESKEITEDNSKKAADQIYDYVMREIEEDFKKGNWYSEYPIDVIQLIKAGVTDFDLGNVYWKKICNLLATRFKAEHYLVVTYTEGGNGKVKIGGWTDDGNRWMED